jgi:pimeloyl-ACP methyl ester carboxylesterase
MREHACRPTEVEFATKEHPMTALSKTIEIDVDGKKIGGTMLVPEAKLPGLLFVHGWGGSQSQDLSRAKSIAALGCECLTFDLRGHAATEAQRDTVTRTENLSDVIAAYDMLAGRPSVDRSAIAVVGSSYGGYLATLLTLQRPVRWLALRVPALYRDTDWDTPKRKLDREDIARYRRGIVPASENRALAACSRFSNDVLIVESEHDDVVPHETLLSYRIAFSSVRSLTYRMLAGADHGLSDPTCREAYSDILTRWTTEMILCARAG